MFDSKSFDGLDTAPGPAIHLVLMLAVERAHYRSSAKNQTEKTQDRVDRSKAEMLWDLAERYHPEQVWLAESWLRGERTLHEIDRTAFCGALAPGFLEAARRMAATEADLRSDAHAAFQAGAAWAEARGHNAV